MLAAQPPRLPRSAQQQRAAKVYDSRDSRAELTLDGEDVRGRRERASAVPRSPTCSKDRVFTEDAGLAELT
jgi:hypothetical protein